METLSEEQARQEAISVIAFLEEGGSQALALPASFIAEVSQMIREEGLASIHTNEQYNITIIGFMVVSDEFLKQKRIIVTGDEEESEEVH